MYMYMYTSVHVTEFVVKLHVHVHEESTFLPPCHVRTKGSIGREIREYYKYLEIDFMKKEKNESIFAKSQVIV